MLLRGCCNLLLCLRAKIPSLTVEVFLLKVYPRADTALPACVLFLVLTSCQALLNRDLLGKQLLGEKVFVLCCFPTHGELLGWHTVLVRGEGSCW